MNIVRENIDELNAVVKLTVAPEDYQETVDNKLKEHRKHAKMSGFRPGKVPMSLVRKMYGNQILLDELNQLVNQKLFKFIVDEKLNIVGEPLPSEKHQKKIDFANDTEFEFAYDLGIVPKFDIDLKEKSFPFYQVEVSEKAIDERVDAYCGRHGKVENTETIGDKDVVTVDCKQVDAEGNEIEGGLNVEATQMSVEYIKVEEIKNQFIGKKGGDTCIVNFKKAYENEGEVASLLKVEKENTTAMEADYLVTIREVRTFIKADVNEELFKAVFNEEVTTLEDFRNKVKEQIEEEYSNLSNIKLGIDLKNEYGGSDLVKLPSDFLRRWLLETRREEVKVEDLDKDFPLIEKEWKWSIVKQNFLTEKEIKVEEEEIMELAKVLTKQQFEQWGYVQGIEEEMLTQFAQKTLENPKEKNKITEQVEEKKFVEAVKAEATLEDRKISYEDFLEILKAQ